MRRTIQQIAVVAGSLLVAGAMAACGTGSPEAGPPAGGTVVMQPDYPGYDSLEALYEHADLVIQARIAGPGESRELKPDAGGTDPAANPEAGAPAAQAVPHEPIVVTVFAAEVVEVLKGTAKAGQTIEVKQLGGVLNGVTYVDASATSLLADTTYLLFLQTYPNAPASLLNPQQGQYLMSASGTMQSVSVQAPTFTYADVVALSKSKKK
jgi:hypothetical protein